MGSGMTRLLLLICLSGSSALQCYQTNLYDVFKDTYLEVNLITTNSILQKCAMKLIFKNVFNCELGYFQLTTEEDEKLGYAEPPTTTSESTLSTSFETIILDSTTTNLDATLITNTASTKVVSEISTAISTDSQISASTSTENNTESLVRSTESSSTSESLETSSVTTTESTETTEVSKSVESTTTSTFSFTETFSNTSPNVFKSAHLSTESPPTTSQSTSNMSSFTQSILSIIFTNTNTTTNDYRKDRADDPDLPVIFVCLTDLCNRSERIGAETISRQIHMPKFSCIANNMKLVGIMQDIYRKVNNSIDKLEMKMTTTTETSVQDRTTNPLPANTGGEASTSTVQTAFFEISWPPPSEADPFFDIRYSFLIMVATVLVTAGAWKLIKWIRHLRANGAEEEPIC